MVFDEKHLKETDYLTETLKTEHGCKERIASEILYQLESVGLCRAVYHRLFNVLLDKALDDNDEE